MAAPESAGSAGGSRQISSVVILFAMEAEAAPLVERLQLQRTPGLLGAAPLTCECFTGSAHGMNVSVVTSGKCWRYGVDSVGTVPAALAAYAVLTTLKPDLLLNAGTAGGFRSRGGGVGDVYVSTASRHHDRRIELPVFDEYGVWHVESLAAKQLAQALDLKLGIVSSGNSLNCTELDRATLDGSGAHVKEMECAAIAYVAHLFKTPFLAVKAITDIVDGDRTSAEEFTENLQKAAQALQEAVPRVLAYVAEKGIESL